MKNAFFVFFVVLFHLLRMGAQPTFTANDFVPPYLGNFGFGVNMGAFQGWTDEQLADISAGNPDLGVRGLGANSVRVWLPESFVETWGYDIRVDAFRHYEQLGMTENVVFIGDPSPVHTDSTLYCQNRYSHSFKNLYAPIWDGGANGTPVNDTNFYAIYVYRLVKKYGAQTRFWEVMNEPDNDLGGNAAAERGHPGNWWENNPPPCETKFSAPIFHYIRMLHITYEIVKSLQPTDYVAIGGIGNASFLDAVLRNSDNPADGSKTALFPEFGGAYFDCLSFHSYPHYDGSVRYWSTSAGGFVTARHSDRAVDGFLERLDALNAVLRSHGYNGREFPRKEIICTETNLTRRTFLPDYLGTDASQRNFIIKNMMIGQAAGIRQIHVYSLADALPEAQAHTDFDFMGLYKNLSGNLPHRTELTEAGVGFKTCATFLKGFSFDEKMTVSLELPPDVRGAAFSDGKNGLKMVLWAVTHTDLSENSSAIYSLPKSLGIKKLIVKKWDFSQTATVNCIAPTQIQLSGDPLFLEAGFENEADCPEGFAVKVFPNPVFEKICLEINSQIDEQISVQLFDATGKRVKNLLDHAVLFAGIKTLEFDRTGLASGIYFLKIKGGSGSTTRKLILL